MNDYITDGALQFLLNGYVDLGSLDTLAERVTTVETKTSRLTYTSALDLLTVSSGMRLSKTLSVNGTAEDTISISCPNGKVMATNVTITNKDDIDSLKLKTSGFNTDGTELTLTKLNDLSMSDYVTNTSLTITLNNYVTNTSLTNSLANYTTNTSFNTLAGRVTTLETKTTGLSYSGGTTVFNAVPKIGNESLIDFFYPIGTLYQSSDNTFNPNTKWGGTWVKIEGRFILGSSSEYPINNTGGSKNVSLTQNNIPQHTHNFNYVGGVYFTEAIFGGALNSNRVYDGGMQTLSDQVTTSQTEHSGTQTAVNIMPPYEVVNIWKRTA